MNFLFSLNNWEGMLFHTIRSPKEPLDVAAWYERADAEDKARRDAENARALDKKSVEKGNKDVLFRYHVARVNETEDFGDEAALTDGDFVLGVRPEFLRLSDSGAIEGEIYSAMPTGMETTVKVRVGSFLLTGVVFGGVLYLAALQAQGIHLRRLFRLR